MNLWVAAAVALLCALAGVALGWWFSRLPRLFWTIGYFIPVVLVFLYALSFYFPVLLFTPPLSWMLFGIKKFAVLGFVASLLLTTLVFRVPQRRVRIVIAVLIVVIVFSQSVWPFLAPMADRRELSSLKTHFDKDGICLQSADYTCGPASAVTALRRLGLPAEEAQIAVLSCTSFQEGTPADMLASGLRNAYRKDGLEVACRIFKNVSELKQAGLTLAIVKYSVMEDHWVTVLGVTGSDIVVGDPLSGLCRLPYDEFTRRWRLSGSFSGAKCRLEFHCHRQSAPD